MSNSDSQSFPCGPTTMIAAPPYNSSTAELIYICGKYEERNTALKSSSSKNFISINKLIALFLAVMIAVVSANDTDTNVAYDVISMPV